MNEIRNDRLIELRLEGDCASGMTPDIEHEREVAIFDLVEENRFRAVGDEKGGPYKLTLSIEESRLVFKIAREDDSPLIAHALSLTPLRRVIKDYFLIQESYHQAIRSGSPERVEAIDMGRRGLHNEGSQTLMERLAGKIEVDFDTARRLFTLVCILHRER